jgi:hypothetical protein
VDVIERKNFNRKSLLGPNNDLAPFNEICGSLYEYVYALNKTGLGEELYSQNKT